MPRTQNSGQALAFATTTCIAQTPAHEIALPPSEGATAVIRSGSAPYVVADGNHLVFEPALSKKLQEATRLVLLGRTIRDEETAYVLLLAQHSSRPASQGRGHCGAGKESTLILLQIVEPRRLLTQRDTLVIDSCLQSIALLDDASTLVEHKLREARSGNELKLNWLSHPHWVGEHTVSIVDGRLRVAPTKP